MPSKTELGPCLVDLTLPRLTYLAEHNAQPQERLTERFIAISLEVTRPASRRRYALKRTLSRRAMYT